MPIYLEENRRDPAAARRRTPMKASSMYIMRCNKCSQIYRDLDQHNPRCPNCSSADAELIDIERIEQEDEYLEDNPERYTKED